MNRSDLDQEILLVALAMAATGTIARTGATLDLSLTESPTDALRFACSSLNGTTQWSLEDSPDGTVWAAVPANLRVSDAANGLSPATGVPVQIAYVGNKQFVRAIHAAPSATAFTSCVAKLSKIARSNLARTFTA